VARNSEGRLTDGVQVNTWRVADPLSLPGCDPLTGRAHD